MCGMKSGCQDFVFEPASGTCVLLPHVASSEKIVSSHNEYTVAGSLQITVVKQEASSHGVCEFQTSSGYSGGGLGEAQISSGDEPIRSKQDCCDACERDPRCSKFTYESYSMACMLFAGYAENYRTDGLMSGIVTERAQGATLPSSTSGAGISSYGGAESGAGAAGTTSPHDAWMDVPPPPVPPTLRMGSLQPPPSPYAPQGL